MKTTLAVLAIMVCMLLIFAGAIQWTLADLGAPTDPVAVAHYGHHGKVLLPDPKVTPGTVRTPDPTELCAAGFTTKKYRQTTAAMKALVYRQYRAVKKPGVCCEVDHLISLELGGADDVKNLWPQPYEPRPGAHEKDKLENALHAEVCAGKVALQEAQRAIATDWYAAYLAEFGLQPAAGDDAQQCQCLHGGPCICYPGQERPECKSGAARTNEHCAAEGQ